MQTVAGWLRRGAAAVLQTGPVPRHVAFIMDGNRRFAERLHLESFRGHSKGYDKVPLILPRSLASFCSDMSRACQGQQLSLRMMRSAVPDLCLPWKTVLSAAAHSARRKHTCIHMQPTEILTLLHIKYTAGASPGVVPGAGRAVRQRVRLQPRELQPQRR